MTSTNTRSIREAARALASKERELESDRQRHAREVRAKLGALVLEEIAERPVDVAQIQRALARAKIFVAPKEIEEILVRLVALGRARREGTLYGVARTNGFTFVIREPARLTAILAEQAARPRGPKPRSSR